MGLAGRQKMMQRAEKLGRNEHYAGRIAKLVKLLDQRDASNLIYAYLLYPDDIAEDLKVIEPAVFGHSDRSDEIFELLDWYRYKAIADIANTTSSLRPKNELSIFQKSK